MYPATLQNGSGMVEEHNKFKLLTCLQFPTYLALKLKGLKGSADYFLELDTYNL